MPNGVRIAILWSAPSSYLSTGLDALVANGATLLFIARRVTADAPHDVKALGHIPEYEWELFPDESLVEQALTQFCPDVILTTSWHIPAYRRAAHRWRRKGAITVLCMDNQWAATARQWLGVAAFRRLRTYWDVAFVPGERQAAFAYKLGFDASRQWHGLYPSSIPTKVDPFDEKFRRFLLPARLVHDKGIDILAIAYALYRKHMGSTAWPLHVAGVGPESNKLTEAGAVQLGFLTPEDLMRELRQAWCVVLPSRFEPWGVALQEGAQSGCVLVSSSAVGASVHLLHDGFNGFLTVPDDARALAFALERLSALDDEMLRVMGQRSLNLSEPYDSKIWATTMLRNIRQIQARRC